MKYLCVKLLLTMQKMVIRLSYHLKMLFVLYQD